MAIKINELCMFQKKVTMLWWDDASNRKKDCNNSKFDTTLHCIYKLT